MLGRLYPQRIGVWYQLELDQLDNLRKALATKRLTQNKPQERSLLSTRQAGIVAFDKSQCYAKDDCASRKENAQKCQDRPLVSQVADDVGF